MGGPWLGWEWYRIGGGPWVRSGIGLGVDPGLGVV